jgi:hypothetical protein
MKKSNKGYYGEIKGIEIHSKKNEKGELVYFIKH